MAPTQRFLNYGPRMVGSVEIQRACRVPWNKLEFGNLEGSRYELEKKVEVWDIVEVER